MVQPLFAHQPVLLSVLVASLLIWRVMEASVDIRTLKRLRTGARRQDKASHAVLICLVTLGILLGAWVAFRVPATAITSARTFLFWLGILLIYAGIAFRLYAIGVLGASFTTTVAVAPEQTVIQTGPYRLIRHPSYTGLLITLRCLDSATVSMWKSTSCRRIWASGIRSTCGAQNGSSPLYCNARQGVPSRSALGITTDRA